MIPIAALLHINCCMGDTILMILESMAVLSCNNDMIAGQEMPMYYYRVTHCT